MIKCVIKETLVAFPVSNSNQKGSYIMKDYQKPEFEVINLVAQEKITASDGVIGGETDVVSSIF